MASLLPKAYQKFYYEWHEPASPVHYIPKAGKYERDDSTGIVKPIQNVAIPLMYPKEFQRYLMGGEAIVKGFRKTLRKRRFPHFWIPNLHRQAVYSEIMNKHMEVTMTDRVIHLIHHYQGFDEYIMQVKY